MLREKTLRTTSSITSYLCQHSCATDSKAQGRQSKQAHNLAPTVKCSYSHSKQDIWAIRNLKQFKTQDEGQVHLSAVLLLECTFFIALDLMTHEVSPCNNIKSHSALFSLTSSSEMSPKEKQPKDHSCISEEICFRFEVVSSLSFGLIWHARVFLTALPIALETYVYIVHIQREKSK